MFKPEFFYTIRNFDKSQLRFDLFAGVTVGLVALPLAMAFAIASGLPPERGLFTAIVAGLLISILGGSRVQIGGPTGAFVVIVAGIVTQHGYEGLVYCTLMAGGLLIAFGLFRMGGLIKFIPFPVTTGFTTGIAVIIFSTQIRDLFGLQIDSTPPHFIEQWVTYSRYFESINFAATGLGVGTIVIILTVRRFLPRMPAMLIGMVAATVASSLLQLDVETISSRFGDLPRQLPTPHLPSFEFSRVRELVSPAFTVGILAAIESLLSATVADGMTGGRHRPNTELVAQGIANIASGIFGGIPATGAIARTATNVKSGGRTPIAGIVHAITLALLLYLVAPLAGMIPLAALAGILIVVSYNMSEIGHFLSFRRAPRSDMMVLLTTFALTVLIDLTVAVQVGVVLAALLFIRRMSEVSNVGMITRELRPDHVDPDDPNSIIIRDVPEGVEVFEIQGPFFFGAADRFRETVRLMERPVDVVILRIRQVPAIDATGLHALREFSIRCKKDGSTIILSGVHAQPLVALQRSGLWDEIGGENILGNIDDALNRARAILGLAPAAHSTPFVPTVAREANRGEKPETPPQ